MIRSIQVTLVLPSPFMDEQRDEELKVSFKTSLHMLQISDEWSFVRLHSSVRLKAATIPCKPLKAQESECASRPKQDRDLVTDHKLHFQATHKGKTRLVSVCLVFHFSSF